MFLNEQNLNKSYTEWASPINLVTSDVTFSGVEEAMRTNKPGLSSQGVILILRDVKS